MKSADIRAGIDWSPRDMTLGLTAQIGRYWLVSFGLGPLVFWIGSGE